ncbi:MAG: YlxR family protein [Candidatus Dormibacteria bacterium]
MRTCVGCRARRPQLELVRVSLNRDGELELRAPGEKRQGRGAYLCANMGCWEKARRRRALPRALRLRGEAPDLSGVAAALAGMISGSPGRTE